MIEDWKLELGIRLDCELGVGLVDWYIGIEMRVKDLVNSYWYLGIWIGNWD